MLISCPNCTTNFSVPDHALGAKGRTLKCAKCGHKWHQDAPRPDDDFALDDFPPPPPPAAPRMEEDFQPVNSPSDLDLDDGPSMSFNPDPDPEPVAEDTRMGRDSGMDFDLDEPPIPDLGPRMNSGDRMSEIDLDTDQPQPIPEVFSSKMQEKDGTGFLWFVVFVLILGGLAGGAYYFQDKVVEFWPPAADLLSDMGLRTEKPGTGLELRKAGTPERLVHNDTEILVVRGIIANVSDRERAVPTMKLILLDKDRNLIQEKLSQPPVTALEAGGTSGFRIILERPDPNAVEVNVLFVDPSETAH